MSSFYKRKSLLNQWSRESLHHRGIIMKYLSQSKAFAPNLLWPGRKTCFSFFCERSILSVWNKRKKKKYELGMNAAQGNHWLNSLTRVCLCATASVTPTWVGVLTGDSDFPTKCLWNNTWHFYCGFTCLPTCWWSSGDDFGCMSAMYLGWNGNYHV